VKKDLNIKEIPELQNEVRKLKFPAKINEGSLEIKLFWAGKGSLYNPPGINGPLIEAISVTRGRKLLFLFMLKPCRILLVSSLYAVRIRNTGRPGLRPGCRSVKLTQIFLSKKSMAQHCF
jgi:hypothetical protein